MTSHDERRGFQRLPLTRPITGRFDGADIHLLDVSASGALLEETQPIGATSGTLTFVWRGERVEVSAEVVRHGDGRPALRFLETNQTLNRMLSESAEELLRAQMANATGDREANRIGEETLTAASAGVVGTNLPFIVCKLKGDGSWSCRPAMLAEQPQDGFTVSSRLLPQQVELLCETYAAGNAESRRLTRLLAELSVTRR